MLIDGFDEDEKEKENKMKENHNEGGRCEDGK